MLVVVWVLNDDLPSVLLFDTRGSFSFCACAAAMLIAVVVSDLRRDLVGPALFRVASPCWQHCFFCLSALVGFSCISFPGRIKGEIEGKNDWKAPLSLCPFIDFPDQVISSASSGILVAADALVAFYAKKKTFLSAAAFVFPTLVRQLHAAVFQVQQRQATLMRMKGASEPAPRTSGDLLWSGILVSAAALVKSHAQRKASLAAAAFVLVFFGAAAANFCVSCTAAVSMTSGHMGLFWDFGFSVHALLR